MAARLGYRYRWTDEDDYTEQNEYLGNMMTLGARAAPGRGHVVGSRPATRSSGCRATTARRWSPGPAASSCPACCGGSSDERRPRQGEQGPMKGGKSS